MFITAHNPELEQSTLSYTSSLKSILILFSSLCHPNNICGLYVFHKIKENVLCGGFIYPSVCDLVNHSRNFLNILGKLLLKSDVVGFHQKV
jgi:hypothetical protein